MTVVDRKPQNSVFLATSNYNYSMFVLRMHAEVDNEEGSTIRLYMYKSMPYKMYGIMLNLHSAKTLQRDFNQVSTKRTGV